MAYISPMLTNVVTAVKKASVHLNRDFSEIERLQNSIKGSMDFARIAYDKIQKCLKVELGKFFPMIPVVLIGEKSPASGMFFSVSAVEGVANFGHGNPHFAISVAIQDGNNVLAGVVYNPARDELFFAEKGKGAYKEGFRSHERLRVSSKQELEGSLIAVKPDFSNPELSAKIVNNAIALTKDVRVSGALALDLAYVASGKMDCVIAPRSMLQSMSAGVLLVKEAGGMILDINQADTRSEDINTVFNSGDLVAVNFNLSQKIANILK